MVVDRGVHGHLEVEAACMDGFRLWKVKPIDVKVMRWPLQEEWTAKPKVWPAVRRCLNHKDQARNKGTKEVIGRSETDSSGRK